MSEVPPLLHISAQINAPEGKLVTGFRIKVDGALVGVDVERVPAHQLAVEGTLGRPLAAGEHNLTIESSGIGEAQAKVLVKQFQSVVPCSSISNEPQWICTARPYKGEPSPGSPFAGLQALPNASFEQFGQALLQELEALQLDSMEVAALDDSGNIYTATHVLSDIEVRKYAPGGQKLEFATVISSCGPGFTALDRIALTGEGQVWIAGHSSACFQPTTDALERGTPTKSGEQRSFLLRVNMSHNPSSPPTYFTFLPEAAHSRVTGLRLDQNGNIYIGGYTTSSTFPRQHVLSFGKGNAASAPVSFVALLKADGSALLNSAVIHGIHISGLAINKEIVAIAGAAGNPASAPQSSASCCSGILATLPTDLSAVTSYKALTGNLNGSIQTLATTTANELLALAYSKQPIRAQVSRERIREMIYSWSPDSSRACSELINTSATPAIVNTPALDAYARHANSTRFCKPNVSSQSH